MIQPENPRQIVNPSATLPQGGIQEAIREAMQTPLAATTSNEAVASDEMTPASDEIIRDRPTRRGPRGSRGSRARFARHAPYSLPTRLRRGRQANDAELHQEPGNDAGMEATSDPADVFNKGQHQSTADSDDKRQHQLFAATVDAAAATDDNGQYQPSTASDDNGQHQSSAATDDNGRPYHDFVDMALHPQNYPTAVIEAEMSRRLAEIGWSEADLDALVEAMAQVYPTPRVRAFWEASHAALEDFRRSFAATVDNGQHLPSAATVDNGQHLPSAAAVDNGQHQSTAAAVLNGAHANEAGEHDNAAIVADRRSASPIPTEFPISALRETIAMEPVGFTLQVASESNHDDNDSGTSVDGPSPDSESSDSDSASTPSESNVDWWLAPIVPSYDSEGNPVFRYGEN